MTILRVGKSGSPKSPFPLGLIKRYANEEEHKMFPNHINSSGLC